MSPFLMVIILLGVFMQVEERVIQLIEEKIADREDLFVVDVKLHPNGRLVISMDGDQGISIQDCAAISRHVGYHLEEENVIEHAYHLEVSSPGVDVPLKNWRQYKKNAGRNVQVKMLDGSEKQGKLVAVGEEGITMDEEVVEKEKNKKAKTSVVQVDIPFEQIATTKVLISFK